MLKLKQILFKHFHKSLNIAVSLTAGCKFLSGKCAHFPLKETCNSYFCVPRKNQALHESVSLKKYQLKTYLTG